MIGEVPNPAGSTSWLEPAGWYKTSRIIQPEEYATSIGYARIISSWEPADRRIESSGLSRAIESDPTHCTIIAHPNCIEYDCFEFGFDRTSQGALVWLINLYKLVLLKLLEVQALNSATRFNETHNETHNETSSSGGIRGPFSQSAADCKQRIKSNWAGEQWMAITIKYN